MLKKINEMVEFLLLCTTSADGLTSHVHMLVSLYSVFLRMPFELETKMSVNKYNLKYPK